METTIIVQETPLTVKTKKGVSRTVKSKSKNLGFYAKKRCIALYAAFILGIALLFVSKFFLGASLILLACGLLFLLKDLDQALTLDLNFNPKDQTNKKINEDLNF
jgi:hypothetical protein